MQALVHWGWIPSPVQPSQRLRSTTMPQLRRMVSGPAAPLVSAAKAFFIRGTAGTASSPRPASAPSDFLRKLRRLGALSPVPFVSFSCFCGRLSFDTSLPCRSDFYTRLRAPQGPLLLGTLQPAQRAHDVHGERNDGAVAFTGHFHEGLKVPQLECRRLLLEDFRSLGQGGRGLLFALGMDDLC